MNICTRVHVASLTVVTDKIRDDKYIAYRVNDNGAIDLRHIGFGHGETRDEAIIDLYKRTK